jgi:hypothetical protein
MIQPLLAVLGVLVNTAILFLIVSGYLRAANSTWARVHNKTVARAILIPLSVVGAVLVFTVSMLLPLWVASYSGVLRSKESLLGLALLLLAVLVGVLIFAVRSPAGRRYAELRIWGQEV